MATTTFQSLVEMVRNFVGPRKLESGDNAIDRYRRNLTPASYVNTRVFFADIEDAVRAADTGNLKLAGNLCSTLRADGTIQGQLSTRYDGLLQLPRYIEGPDEEINAQLALEFDEVFPAPELSLMSADGGLLGVMFGEFVSEYPGHIKLVRRNPEFLQYRRNEDRWHVGTQSEGMQPVTPNDGRWVLHFPGGTEHPWRAKTMWRALARAYTVKEHALHYVDAWNNSLAWPAKVVTSKSGSTTEEREEFLTLLEQYAQNSNYILPEGWQFAFQQASGNGYQTFAQSIELADKESILTINGQTPTTEGSPGFSNLAIHAQIRSDLIQSDANALTAALVHQCLPVWTNERFGWGAISRSPSIRWDVTPPKDRAAEASAANVMGQAIKSWSEALAATGSDQVVDVAAMAERFGIALRPGKYVAQPATPGTSVMSSVSPLRAVRK